MSAQRELDVLARTVYGEARGETQEGRIAVAHVILNRARRGGWWGNDIISVCLAPKQFSCWNDGDPNRASLMAADEGDIAFAFCLMAALLAYNGTAPDPTGGACHYHTHAVSPRWAADADDFITIGNHKFYRSIA